MKPCYFFSWYIKRGFGWFRFFDKRGLHWKNIDQHRLTFSERNGNTKYVKIGKWVIMLLK